MKKVTIYTDGACSGNPGPGGWGAVLLYKQHKTEISGGEGETTNNRMEITAVIEALKRLKEPCEAEIYSDSAYVVDAFEKRWIEGWLKNGWKTANKDDVKNRDLWEMLHGQSQIHKIAFKKVKGHADNELNNRCDELARNAIKNI